MTDATNTTGSWRILFSPTYLGTAALIVGGVSLYAVNEFLTISLLPSIVADIGGERLYAWVTTLYLVGSVMAATTVYSVLARLGARASYLLGLTVFGVGTLICSVAPGMEVLLVGRTLQGAAGGLLAGLSYTVINAALPPPLWTRASALTAAIWAVATLIGPITGGLFAQFDVWRWAFGSMVIVTVTLALMVPTVLTAGPIERSGSKPVPRATLWPVVALGVAVLSVSIAGLPHNALATAALLAAGGLLVGTLLAAEWRIRAVVLPPSTYGSGPLKWTYLAMALLMAAAMVESYVPLFGHRLAHLTPVVAGLLGAALALGWTVSEVVSASLNSPRIIARLVAASPVVMAAGLALAAITQRDNAPAGVVVLWALALLVTGIGIGVPWPHLSAWAMHCVDDPAEGRSAAAAINTVQLVSGALGAGLAGVVVNTAGGREVTAARWLFVVFMVLAIFGAIASYRASRGQF